MDEQKAICVLNQICEHLERTGRMDNERKNALEIAMKSLSYTTEFCLKNFVESMMKISEETNANEITYSWELKDCRKVGLCFTVFSGEKDCKKEH